MAKELYLYSGIYSFVAEALIAGLEENKGDKVLRIDSPGGGVSPTWGMCAKVAEVKSKLKIKVDGSAFSGAANLCLYADDVECLDTSTFMFHRADGPTDTPEEKQLLDKINNDLKAKMLLKIDSAKLKALKGVSIEELFTSEPRIHLFLNAQEALALGIVKKVNQLNPAEVEAMAINFHKIAAEAPAPAPAPKPDPTNSNVNKMTLDKLKAEHPELFKEIVALGVTQERIRAKAFLAFIDTDKEAVAKAIKEGAEWDSAVQAEFVQKSISAVQTKKIEDESPDGTDTTEVTEAEKTEKQKAVASFESEVKAHLNLK